MLVIGRRIGERILIGGGIVVQVVDIRPGRNGPMVKLGLAAPRDIKILREEIAGELATPTAKPAGPKKTETGHVLLTPETCDKKNHAEYNRCPVCDWRLAICARCGKAERDLEQRCPYDRTRAEVLAARNTVVGCCNRHADNMACDCLKKARDD